MFGRTMSAVLAAAMAAAVGCGSTTGVPTPPTERAHVWDYRSPFDIGFRSRSADPVDGVEFLFLLAKWLIECGDCRVVLTGHCDSQEASLDEDLANARARAVSAFLEQHGVARSQVAVYPGKQPPPSFDETEAQLSRNRRVSISIHDHRVRLSESKSAAWRVTGRKFLVGNQAEDPGYGLYSYLLLPREPSPSDDGLRTRYLGAIGEYLSIARIKDFDLQPEPPPPRNLNIAYLPLREVPSRLTPDDLLSRYNWPLAQTILGRLLLLNRGGRRDGPFILSHNQPLSSAKSLPGRPLFIDMSRVPARVISLYVRRLSIRLPRSGSGSRTDRRRGCLLATLSSNAGVKPWENWN